jgi:8-oxo-dGTP pyrophosphatase MutT (NUDIX family)
MPHLHYRYDFVVSVFIVHDERVLMVNHPRYSRWLPVGGHIELDEDPEQALYREIDEECGLEVEIIGSKPEFGANDARPLLSARYIEVHDANLPHEHIALIYFGRAKSDKFVLSDEHTDMRWLHDTDFDKVEYDLPESVRFYCRQALQITRL